MRSRPKQSRLSGEDGVTRRGGLEGIRRRFWIASVVLPVEMGLGQLDLVIDVDEDSVCGELGAKLESEVGRSDLESDDAGWLE